MSRIELITSKLKRAEKHIRDFEAGIGAFFDSDAYVVLSKDDLATRQRIYYVGSVRDVPPGTIAIAGDAIHNLRSALDHLAWQLVLAGGSTPSSVTCFPIAEDATKYKTERIRKVKGMGQAAIDAIDAIKPYKGGNTAPWRLHRLDVIDKHRVLITAGSALMGHGLRPSAHKFATENWISRNPGVPVPDFSQPFARPHIVCKSVKAGSVLLRVPESEKEDYVNFRFAVAFNEPRILQGEPIIETLHEFSHLVGDIVSRFAALL